MIIKRKPGILKEGFKKIVKGIEKMPFDNRPAPKPSYIELKTFAALGGIKGAIFRQKEFNTAARKLIKNKALIRGVAGSRSNSIAAGIVSRLNKAKASVLRGVEQTTGLPSLRGKVQKAENLSNPLNAAKRVGRKTGKARRLIENIDQNPGGLARESVAKTAENPILVGGTAAGWVPTIVSGGKVVVPGMTELAMAGEVAASGNEKYNRITKGIGKKIREGRVGNIIEQGTNTVRRSMPLFLV